jgi:hypothetical protein
MKEMIPMLSTSRYTNPILRKGDGIQGVQEMKMSRPENTGYGKVTILMPAIRELKLSIAQTQGNKKKLY